MKTHSISGVSILAQLSAWRTDDSFRPDDKRIGLIVSAMVLIELVRLGRIKGTVEKGLLMLEVDDKEPVGDFILDGALFWMEGCPRTAADVLIEDQSATSLARVVTSLVAQGVLSDSGDGIVIDGSKQDYLRSVLRRSLFVPDSSVYAHESVFQVIASSYNPHASLVFSLLGMPFDTITMNQLFARRSPWMDEAPEQRETIRLIMDALYLSTKSA